MHKFFDCLLKKIADKFGEDPSKMLIWTGVVGWATSAFAQVFAIYINPRISKEKKSFLIPQEMADAAVNIGSFFLITQFAKKSVSKLFSTGKFAPKSVKEFFEKNKDTYAEKIGKYDFNIETIKKTTENFPVKNYDTCKSLGTTIATVAGGIVSSNIVTPIIRNAMASNFQRAYIDYNKSNPYRNSSSNMKI